MRRGGYEPFGGPMRTKNWGNPGRWNRAAARDGRRARVFTCSMSDFFHPGADSWRDEAWEVIRGCESLDWLILTKRPELVEDRLPDDWGDGYPNVWLGVTAGCQSSLPRLEILSQIPSAVRFVSAEPLLEAIDLRPYLDSLDGVITGCERAKKGDRRLMDLNWVREIDAHCTAFGVPDFFGGTTKGQSILREDRLLNGELRQNGPLSRAAVST